MFAEYLVPRVVCVSHCLYFVILFCCHFFFFIFSSFVCQSIECSSSIYALINTLVSELFSLLHRVMVFNATFNNMFMDFNYLDIRNL
jgi:predicted PurR-regulated permease PerM